MKTILLLVHDDDGQEARLQAALDVARAVEGHLQCLDVAILPLLPLGYVGVEGEAMLLADEQTRESRNRALIEERLRHEDVPWDWVDICGPLVESLTDAAALADLIVVNRKLDDFPVPDMLNTATGVIVGSRKPVLAVPAASRGIRLFERALIAWNGSQSAAAAMRAAVPLLKLAEAVTLLAIDDGTIETPAEEAAAFLSREGVHVAVRKELSERHLVADRLCAESRSGHFAYIVMGGFGHSPLRESIFGGATRQMLSESAVPLLLAH